jgi:Protein of unknown function (DUF4058)
MASPFPGMNPYLEHPEMWSEVHHMLISILAEILTPQLLPTYRAAIDKRVYYISGEDALLVGISDVTIDQRSRSGARANPTGTAVAILPSTPTTVQLPMTIEVREGYLEIREVASLEVITVIELLSPANKRSGKGRVVYEEKRQQILSSPAHLIEIDLLRDGSPMPLLGNPSPADYRIMVSRRNVRPQADLYRFNVRDRIPSFPLPLRSGDLEPVVDLQNALLEVYNRLSYDLIVDYNRPPFPPLNDDDSAWANDLLGNRR